MGISTAIKRITFRRWSWISFKVFAFCYGLMLLLFTPSAVQEVIPGAIRNVSLGLMVGAAISIVGIVMVSQFGRTAVWGLTVELIGIFLVGGSTLAYLLTQIYLSVTLPNGTDRIALCFLLTWVLAALFARTVIVMPRRHKEGHDSRKDG